MANPTAITNPSEHPFSAHAHTISTGDAASRQNLMNASACLQQQKPISFVARPPAFLRICFRALSGYLEGSRAGRALARLAAWGSTDR
jgi:hypothetical protein